MKTTSVKQVLLIEPDSVQGLAITRLLSTASLQLHIASSAQSAVSTADGIVPNAVILELALPEHNGIEFLHEFRSYPEWAEVPIIIFSQQRVDDVTVFKGLGDITYLYKPTTSLAALKKQLEHVLA